MVLLEYTKNPKIMVIIVQNLIMNWQFATEVCSLWLCIKNIASFYFLHYTNLS